MVSARRTVAVTAALLASPAAAPAHAQTATPLGIVEQTFGHFDRDTLTPLAPSLPLREPHARPVFSPDERRLALGLSAPGTSNGRVGVWIVDPARVKVLHEVVTGIAAEAVVYPGVVGALLQNGQLVIIDPASGKIRSRREIGRTSCAPDAVQTATRGVIVNEIGRDTVEVTIVDPRGKIHTLRLPLETIDRNCRKVGLAADATRVYVTTAHRIAAIDPVTRHVDIRRATGGTDADVVPGGLAVAGSAGLTVVDTTTWKTSWRDRTARNVLTQANTVVGTGTGTVTARDARTGRLLWRAPGAAQAVAAGRVYAQPAVLDLATGKQVGTHPPVFSAIRFVINRKTDRVLLGAPG
ncbi:hypothetical protein OM076_21495 [Solirubrobacter ginsenosidimutans]|uniref:YncE family protein n=1 Tax=Solirubrobacter ginsenosidimutans TaxID=490573 RepID=A0A9X3N0Y7_9ACTN|nr:hypothetical protein [Solirubrobacter ginsenosidimutans]MDA0162863.1 hypothetical protein [Solirubrobacter ginsenosidimutans]